MRSCCLKFWCILGDKGLKRNKGKIIVKFIEPIKPGLDREKFEEKLEIAIESETKILIDRSN